MASIVLAAAGASIGAGFGGTILGLSGAVIGQAAGSIIGTIIDSRIIASFAPNQISEGARLESLRVTSSTEGSVIPNVYGRMKIGGNICSRVQRLKLRNIIFVLLIPNRSNKHWLQLQVDVWH